MRAANFLRIIFVSAALAGCCFWLSSGRGGDSGLDSQQSLPMPDRIPLLSRAQADAWWRDPSTLFVDVRSPEDYNIGHITGSVNLPYEEMPERLAELRPKLERATRLVVYCKSTDCGKSLWAAIQLRNEGLPGVAIYPGGWNEWVLAGLATAGEGR